MKLFAVLLAIVGLALASGTISGRPGGTGGGYWLPQTDYIYDTYAYNQGEQMSTVGASFGDYAVIDDFPWSTNPIFTYTCWGVTTGSAPTSLNLLIVEDNGGVPTGAPLSSNSYSVTTGDTGYTFGGYIIWVAELDLSDHPSFNNSWIGSHRSNGINWYPLGGTTVTGAEGHRTLAAGWSWVAFSDPSSGLEPGDLFKVIDGAPPPSLERNTWASIKNLF